jgi:tellurite resistance protein TerC
VYTGIKLFSKGEEAEFNPEQSGVYRFIKKFIRTTGDDGHGRYIVMRHKKAYFTQLSMVVVMLALIDILFAIDSIPAVFSIIPDPNKKLLIYSSNIFAVLGLRSMFFLLRGAASKFDFLQQGIAIVLVLIGLKMLAARWVHVPVWAFLPLIVLCIGGSIWYSIYHKRKGAPADKIS